MSSEQLLTPSLAQLAFACHVFNGMENYDSAYGEFLIGVDDKPDLTVAGHRQELLRWLNKWGCRQFSKEYHSLASDEIKDWYDEFGPGLISRDKALWELSEVELAIVGEAYGHLAKRIASWRNGSKIRVGPTGAAKILFALKPKALPPWDEPIRQTLNHDGSAQSYLKYLAQIRNVLWQLGESCQREGYRLENLPKLLGRHKTSVVKLIDEFFWVTITKGCPVPTQETFIRWTSWGDYGN